MSMPPYTSKFTWLAIAFLPSILMTEAGPGTNRAAFGETVAKFTDISATAGLEGIGNGKAAWGDFDNDGDPDLYVSGVLWRNTEGTFTPVDGTGLGGEGIWGDYDRDNRLDFFAYSTRRLFRSIGDGQFVETTSTLPDLPMVTTRGAVWGDFDGDHDLDLYVGAYEQPGYQPDAILLNDGDAGFRLHWQQSGDVDPSRGIISADYDEDGDLDVYVSNYRLEQNQLWNNDGTATFTNVGPEAGVQGIDDGWTYSYGHTIGSAFGDMDDDGHIDLFVGNFSHSPAWQDRARAYRNLGPDEKWKFQEMKVWQGNDWQESYASPVFGDIDNDGDLDLFFTTVYGHNHSRLYRNDGNFNFVNVTDAWGLGGLAPSYQAAFADVDGDGWLDLLTSGRLFRNPGGMHHYLKVRLEGVGHYDAAAIGAQARIRLEGRTLTRHVGAAVGEGNQNEQVIHFGLGEHQGPVTLEIRWPDGKVQEVISQEVDRTITVRPAHAAPAR